MNAAKGYAASKRFGAGAQRRTRLSDTAGSIPASPAKAKYGHFFRPISQSRVTKGKGKQTPTLSRNGSNQ